MTWANENKKNQLFLVNFEKILHETFIIFRYKYKLYVYVFILYIYIYSNFVKIICRFLNCIFKIFSPVKTIEFHI